VPKRDPHDVLGLRPGASATTVRAAWRRLAREHHPDVIGEDQAAARTATRRMAEINAAYETLRREHADRSAGVPGDGTATSSPDVDAPPRRRGGPPRPKPTRPVTARLDLSGTVRPRNATTSSPGARPRGHVPLRANRMEAEPPRASDPTGPLERGRVHRFRRPRPPALETAREIVLEFGKFRGHTLAEVAAFEPSYVDWLAQTVSRDPDLVAAARVVVADLDRRGVVRRPRPAPTRGSAGRIA
jgi:hypothetical protein